MSVKMLKPIWAILVLIAFLVVPASLLSDTTHTDKKCGEPSTSERKLKKGSGCGTNYVRQSCDNAKSPTYEVEEAAGCTVDAPEEGTYPDITYHLCWEGEAIVEHGTVSCIWENNSCTEGSDWSVTDKKFKTCRDDSFELYE